MVNERAQMATDQEIELKREIGVAESQGYAAASIELTERLLKIAPDSPYYKYLYGENLRVVGRCRQAEQVLLEIDIELIPQERKHLVALQLGQLYQAMGLFAQAEAQYKRATELNPHITDTWILFGNFLMQCDRFPDAIDSLRRGLQAAGNLDEVHINLGDCYRAQRLYEQARQHYLQALDIDPNYTDGRKKLNDVVAAMDVAKGSYGI